MNTHVIITKEPGQSIPKGYLQEALKQCPTCIGITIQDKVGEDPVLDCTAQNKTMSVDDVLKIVESCKDVRMVIVLAKMDQDFDAETDMQPFVFQQKVQGEDDPQNILAFHVEGDFPNYCKPGKGHTDEYNFWEDCIFPTLLEKFEASEDLAQFFTKIAGSPMKQMCENPIGHRGVAVFIPLEGEIIAFGRNDIGGQFDWGTTSNRFNWGSSTTKLEKAAEAAVDAVKKTGGRLAKLMGTAAPAVTPTAPGTSVPSSPKETPAIKTDDKGIHHTSGNDPFARWPGTSSKTHVMRTVPSGLVGNARNRWIRLFTNNEKGDLPKGKDAKEFAVPIPLSLDPFAQEDVSTNDSVRELADRVKKFPGSKGNSVSQQMVEAAKADVKNPAATNRPTEDFLPECPADEAKASAELVTEWATNPKQPTSLEVQRIESKWPAFTKSRGITLENVARWSIAEKKLFTKKCPNDAARLISELVLKLHELGAFDPSVNTEHVDKTTDVEVNVTGGDKSKNNTSPQPGPAPAKGKGRLARLTGNAA